MNIFDELDKEIDPPTLEEFNLGMCLAAIRDMLDNPDEYGEDIESCLIGVLERADECLVHWSNKYSQYMKAAIQGGGDLE